MPVLSAIDLGHAFGATELYHEATLSLDVRDRAGLVGPNGVGKTTLLLNLAGLLEPTSGSVIVNADLKLGYLRQEAVLMFAGQDNTVFEEMLTVFAPLVEQETELRRLEARMADGESTEALFSEYGRLQELFELEGGYDYQQEIKRVLLGLGFTQEQWSTPLQQLSGGQKTRILLARLLLEAPELLILDEPTNHLDTAAIEWLEMTLRQWEGALIIVSHDRFFLDRVVNRVWEMVPQANDEPAEVRAYKGNYTAFVRQRDEAWERSQRLFTEERDRLERDAEFIQKHIAGGQTDLAKGRLRQLTRDLALIEQVGIVEMAEIRRGNRGWLEVGTRGRTLTINEAIQQIRALRPPDERPPRLDMHLDTGQRSGRAVLRGRDMVIGYPDSPLFSIAKVRLERGARVALLGPNGSGKSTMLRTVMNELYPLEGDFERGENVQIGYFAQAHDQLTLENRVIDELLSKSDMGTQAVRSYLARYLFRGDDVFKLVSELSGGERGRLALALLALNGANLLLLDEPTNHLDIPSQEVLQDALESFDGSMLIVSHDRYLVDRLATEIWSIEDGRLEVYPASYQDYRAQQQGGAGEGAVPEIVPPLPAELPPVELTEESLEGAQAARRRLQPHEARKLRELAELREDLEDWLARIEETIDEFRVVGDFARVEELALEQHTAEEELAELLLEWAKLTGEQFNPQDNESADR